MSDVVEQLDEIVSGDHRETARTLDELRLSLGKGNNLSDLEVWNALINAASHLRIEAERRDPKSDLYKALNTPGTIFYGGHDTKYRFENGQYVNRTSGEAIPLDEPIMIFRARDVHALPTIKAYRSMILDVSHCQAVDRQIEAFKTFAQAHPERMREPGVHRQVVNKDLGDPI